MHAAGRTPHLTIAAFFAVLVVTLAVPVVSTAQTRTLTFDEAQAPCAFLETQPLTTAYDSQGIAFNGPDVLSGGAVLNECANFAVNGYSPPNFLAFNSGANYASGGVAIGPETMSFAQPVESVEMRIGSADGGTGTLTAYSGDTEVDQQSIILGSTLVPLRVEAASITRVVLSFTPGLLVVDDLTWTLAPQANTPVTKDDCKHGGWATHTRADGTPFKNQGDCIQYVNTGR